MEMRPDVKTDGLPSCALFAQLQQCLDTRWAGPPCIRRPTAPPETLRAYYHSATWRGTHKAAIEIVATSAAVRMLPSIRGDAPPALGMPPPLHWGCRPPRAGCADTDALAGPTQVHYLGIPRCISCADTDALAVPTQMP
jgi:hypothetical protein